MNILITGGSGFQGRHLARHLVARGHDVSILSTPSARSREAIIPASRVWGSITDRALVRDAVESRDVIVHMAAIANPLRAMRDPDLTYRINVLGTQILLDAIVRDENQSRLIHASSCEVYGPSDGRLQDEDAPMNPPSIYAASKCAADRLVYAYTKTFGVNAVIVRPCNIFGPEQAAGTYGAVIPTFVSRALQGRSLVVHGDGQQSREYMYVDDIVHVYTTIIEQGWPQQRVFNVGSGVCVTIKEIAEYVAGHFSVPITFGPSRSGEVSGFTLNSRRAAEAWGFIPSVPFRDGLNHYLAWASSRGQECRQHA